MNTLIATGLSNIGMAAVLALAAGIVGRCCRRPALTHALWVLVLLKLVTPPLVSVPLAGFFPQPQPAVVAKNVPTESSPELALLPVNPPIARETESDRRRSLLGEESQLPFAPLTSENPSPERGVSPQPMSKVEAPAKGPERVTQTAGPAWTIPWFSLFITLWLIGSGFWLIVFVRRVGQLQCMFRRAKAGPAELQRETEELAGRLQVRCPQVWLVDGVVSPMLWVMGRQRRLLLPETLLGRLSAEQRATLLAHELAHLRRGDFWVRYLELVVLALYWWCPLVWWARSELHEAEEECCDAWVVWALPGSARAYALALVETVDFVSQVRPALPALASGFGHVQMLRRRLTMIMRGTTPRLLTAWGTFMILCAGTLLLPLLPTWAQAPREEARDRGQKRAQTADEAELRELKQVVEDLRDEIDEARAELREKRAAIDALGKDLKKAMKRPGQFRIEEIPGTSLRRYSESFQAPSPDHPVPLPQPVPEVNPLPQRDAKQQAQLERRLADLERRLAQALRELHDLRRELGLLRTPSADKQPLPPAYRVPAQPNPPPLGYVMPSRTR